MRQSRESLNTSVKPEEVGKYTENMNVDLGVSLISTLVIMCVDMKRVGLTKWSRRERQCDPTPTYVFL